LQLARRKSTRNQFVQLKRKRERYEADHEAANQRSSAASAEIGEASLQSGPAESLACQVATLPQHMVPSQMQNHDEPMQPPMNATGDKMPSPASVGKSAAEDERKQSAQPSISSLPQENAGTTTVTSNQTPTVANVNAIRFRALKQDGQVDMHEYHRGQEGQEYRDEVTGDLLFDTDPVDSRHTKTDEVKTKSKVIIQFPIDSDGRTYKETVEWDLSDPRMHTPMTFAASVAGEFGLPYGQAVELANSIQRQLSVFVSDNCSYANPVPLRDTTGVEQDIPATKPVHFYGSVTSQYGLGGFDLSATPRVKSFKRSSSIASRSVSTEVPERPKAQKLNKEQKVPSLSSTTTTTAKVEQIYRDEVQKRLNHAFQVEATNRSAKSGQTSRVIDAECHICQEKGESVELMCHIGRHGFCAAHRQKSAEEQQQVSEDQPKVYEICPVCCLTCTCDPCVRRLNSMAVHMNKLCLKQAVPLDKVELEDILPKCRSREVRSISALNRQKKATSNVSDNNDDDTSDRRNSASRASIGEAIDVQVNKVPPYEFPREVSLSVDLDPASEKDYRTVFTSKGTFELSVYQLPNLQAEYYVCPSHLQDGGIDVCLICNKNGVLLCCSVCPRAFHTTCLKSEDEVGRLDAPWKCPSCCAEDTGLVTDSISGSESLPLISAAYANSKADMSESDQAMLRVLSIIHQMMIFLMQYDFGYMFKEPVDCKLFKTYLTLVKTPMDLGTISKRLVNGEYKLEDFGSLEDVVVKVLEDIELVWQNCFVFNSEGSAVYRMAELLKRRAYSIRMRSFDFMLTDSIKQKIGQNANFSTVRKLDWSRFNSRYKISSLSRTSSGKAVAVFDPSTGRLVKVYSTVQAASFAAERLLKAGHQSEMPNIILGTDLINKMRRFINDCKLKPGPTLFGYRWLYWEDLKNGKVRLQDDPSVLKILEDSKAQDTVGAVQQQHHQEDDMRKELMGAFELTFNANRYYLPESESAPLPDIVITSSLKDKLNSLSYGSRYVDGEGRQWLRLSGERDTSQVAHPFQDVDQAAYFGSNQEEGTSSLSVSASLVATPSSPTAAAAATSTEGNQAPVFIRENIPDNKVEAQFLTLEEVYEDWKAALCKHTRISEDTDTNSIDVFQSQYLDKNRNIGGVFWKTISQEESNAAKVALDKSSSSSPSRSSQSAESPIASSDVVAMEIDGEVKTSSDTQPEMMGVDVRVNGHNSLMVQKVSEDQA
jgi:Bromodomain/SNF5 / SMARCB1 / INI1